MVAVLTERETLGLEGIYKWNFFVVFPILYVCCRTQLCSMQVIWDMLRL